MSHEGQQGEDPIVSIQLRISSVNAILGKLSELPYRDVHQVIASIQTQAQEQIKAQANAQDKTEDKPETQALQEYVKPEVAEVVKARALPYNFEPYTGSSDISSLYYALVNTGIIDCQVAFIKLLAPYTTLPVDCTLQEVLDYIHDRWPATSDITTSNPLTADKAPLLIVDNLTLKLNPSFEAA